MRANRSIIGRMAVMAVLLMGTLVAGPAAGLSIEPGVNLFTTVPGTPGSGTGSGTSYDFGGTSPPIPADFFDPGSDPFTGVIYLQGLPLDPPAYGSTDTVVKRHGGPLDPPFPPDSVDIPIELVALNLVSCQPITVTYGGTGSSELWDVEVSLSPTAPSMGAMQVQKTHANGGVFSSSFQVQPLLTFTRQNSSEVRVLGDDEQLFDSLTLQSCVWSYTATDVLNIPSYEGGPGTGGNFIPGVDSSFVETIFPLRYEGNQFHLEMQVTPAPEPGTLALLGILGVCLGGYVWRKRRRVRA